MPRLHTIGHSTRSFEAFLALLREHDIACLIDIRRFPTSKRHPHFNGDTLAAKLRVQGLEYLHEPDLGGFRKALQNSPNTAWEVAGFRGYADYMNAGEFRRALERVIEGAKQAPTCLMCAEARPLRCHRRLVSDALVAQGFEVLHILDPGMIESRQLHPNAQLLANGRLVYPAAPPDQIGLFPPADS
jgi:uncharacterized protein (DUF488 family)